MKYRMHYAFLAGAGLVAMSLAARAQTCELVKDINAQPDIAFRNLFARGPIDSGRLRNGKMTRLGDYWYFYAGSRDDRSDQLWRSNGVICEQACQLNGEKGAFPNDIIAYRGKVYFAAQGLSVGFELHAFDPNTKTCALVKDIRPGSSSGGPGFLTVCRDKLYFVASVSSTTGRRVFVSDGTEAGTVPISTASDASVLTCCGDMLYFSARHPDGTGSEPWISDGTAAGTKLLKSIRSGPHGSAPHSFACLGDKVIFEANDGVHGNELWISDGTTAGTQLLVDIQRGAGSGLSPSTDRGLFDACSFGGKLYFAADDGSSGEEVWVTDGTAAGTRRAFDLAPGSLGSRPTEMTALLGKMFFTATASGATDGTAEPYVTDGTLAGTTRLLGPGSGRIGGMGFTAIAGSKVAFAASTPSTGSELFVTDGSAAGTRLLKDIDPGDRGSYPEALTSHPDGRVLLIRGNPRNIWVSDGTTSGTREVYPTPTLNGLSQSNVHPLLDVYGQLWFPADDGVHGSELWRHDPTTGRTELMSDINPGASRSEPRYYYLAGRHLVFSAEGPHGRELYGADTASGKVELIKDIQPGPVGSSPAAVGVCVERQALLRRRRRHPRTRVVGYRRHGCQHDLVEGYRSSRRWQPRVFSCPRRQTLLHRLLAADGPRTLGHRRYHCRNPAREGHPSRSDE